MYITLDLTEHHYGYRYKAQKTDLSNLPKPDFMPTKLVRTSDMAVVKGSDVDEGYCALSYSWNQSGEILHDEATGKSKRIDRGEHKIISYDNNMSPFLIIPSYKLFQSDKLEKIYQALNIMDKNNYFFTKTTKYVKFEGIVQKICQQFNIKYIWIDQLCINQGDKEEKHREIRKMHHIYSNAYCTVALVPELYHCCYDKPLGEDGEEYFKRLWTLEEAIKSEKLLFAGRNTHQWGKELKPSDDTRILNKQLPKVSVSQVLYHAHQRTSTKGHDRVFALIHLFPEFMRHIDIDYDQPLEELIIRFYILLAKKDLTILLFGKCIGYKPYSSTIQKYKFLPSWTGVNGKHVTDDVTTSFRSYDIIGKAMNVTSNFVMSCQLIDNGALTIRKEDLPPLPPGGDINDDDDHDELRYILCTTVQFPGSGETRDVSLAYSFNDIAEKEELLNEISITLKQLSRFMETNKKNLHWRHEDKEEYRTVIFIDFDYLTEYVDDLSAQYIILSEVSFKNEYSGFYFPVIKKKQGEEYYKAIGCLKITTFREKDISFDCNLPEQTFSIQ